MEPGTQNQTNLTRGPHRRDNLCRGQAKSQRGLWRAPYPRRAPICPRTLASSVNRAAGSGRAGSPTRDRSGAGRCSSWCRRLALSIAGDAAIHSGPRTKRRPTQPSASRRGRVYLAMSRRSVSLPACVSFHVVPRCSSRPHAFRRCTASQSISRSKSSPLAAHFKMSFSDGLRRRRMIPKHPCELQGFEVGETQSETALGHRI
jgi:hypothetical protein